MVLSVVLMDSLAQVLALVSEFEPSKGYPGVVHRTSEGSHPVTVAHATLPQAVGLHHKSFHISPAVVPGCVGGVCCFPAVGVAGGGRGSSADSVAL